MNEQQHAISIRLIDGEQVHETERVCTDPGSAAEAAIREFLPDTEAQPQLKRALEGGLGEVINSFIKLMEEDGLDSTNRADRDEQPSNS